MCYVRQHAHEHDMKVESVLAFIVQLGRPPNDGHVRYSLDPLVAQKVKLIAPASASQVDENAFVNVVVKVVSVTRGAVAWN